MTIFSKAKDSVSGVKMTNWSTYGAFAVWGAGAFTSQPTIASGIVHFSILPLFLFITILLAHHEGKRRAK